MEHLSVWTDLSTYNTLQLAVQQLCNQQMKRATLITREKLIDVLQLRTIAQIKGVIINAFLTSSHACSMVKSEVLFQQNLTRPTGRDKIRAKISRG